MTDQLFANAAPSPEETSRRMYETIAALRHLRIVPHSERDLQAAVFGHLSKAGILFTEEVRLAASDRIDFLAEGGIGIELKVDGGTAAVFRQLERYAAQPRIAALVLVTTRLRHTAPDTMNGKPVATLYVGSPF